MTSISIGNWNNLDVHTLTNIFLYGQTTTPENHYDRLRSSSEYADTPIVVVLDAVSFMETGAGRFAHASDTSFVQNFLSGAYSSLLPPKTYTREELIGNFGFSRTDFVAVYDQSNYDINSADYALRTYIYGRTSFVISSDTQFIVNPDGSREIKNLAMLPQVDNFDFSSNNLITLLGNTTILEPNIDPYEIGSQITFQFANDRSVPRIPSYNYLQDMADAANEPNVNDA